MTGFTSCGIRSAPSTLKPSAAAATEWTGALGRHRGRLNLWQFHGGYNRIPFLQTFGDFRECAIADAGFDAQRFGRGHRIASASGSIGGQDVNRSRRGLCRAWVGPCPATYAAKSTSRTLQGTALEQLAQL